MSFEFHIPLRLSTLMGGAIYLLLILGLNISEHVSDKSCCSCYAPRTMAEHNQRIIITVLVLISISCRTATSDVLIPGKFKIHRVHLVPFSPIRPVQMTCQRILHPHLPRSLHRPA